ALLVEYILYLGGGKENASHTVVNVHQAAGRGSGERRPRGIENEAFGLGHLARDVITIFEDNDSFLLGESGRGQQQDQQQQSINTSNHRQTRLRWRNGKPSPPHAKGTFSRSGLKSKRFVRRFLR